MKRNNLKPIVISALMAVSFGATTVGTSFALFTDRADTKIDVTAGIVDINTEVKLVKYENTGDLTNTTKEFAATDTSYTTEIGTVIQLVNDGKDVEITNMVPGDKIELSVALYNKSNVKTKYRLTAQNNAGDLAKALKVQASGGSTAWTELAAYNGDNAKGKLVETATVVIEFVNYDDGILAREDPASRNNPFMGKTVRYSLAYEIVQGNAVVTDTEPVGFNAFEEKVLPVLDTDTGEYKWSKEVAAVMTLSGKAEDTSEVTVTVGNDVENANFTFAGAETVSYDIHVEGYKDAVEVSVFVGKGYETVQIWHETATGTVEVAGNYNPETGYVTFSTETFSPYHFVGIEKDENVTMVKDEAELRSALEAGGKIGLKNDIFSLLRFNGTASVELFGYGHEIKVGSTLKADGSEDVHGDNRAFDVTEQENKTYKFHDVHIVENQKGAIGDAYRRGFSMYGSKNIDVNFDNVVLSSDYYAINIAGSNDNVTVNMDKASVAGGWCAFQSWSPNVTFNIANSTLRGLNNKTLNKDGWNDFSTMVMNQPATDNTINLNNVLVESYYSVLPSGEHNNQTAFSFRSTNTVVNSNKTIYTVNDEELDILEHFWSELTQFSYTQSITTLQFYVDGDLVELN